MFLGTHEPRLDEKGRLFMPARFRDELADGLVITKGQDRCLFVFTAQEFARMAEALRAEPATGRDLRANNRLFFASASAEELDRQGRVTIPPPLRTYARLDRDVVVIGANTRVEIWDRPTWEAYLAETESGFAEGDEEVLPGVL